MVCAYSEQCAINAQRLVVLLQQQRRSIVTVESCSGGLLAATITALAGVSNCFVGGYVTYHNTFKQSIGVPEQTLLRYGAVSKEVVAAMLAGALAQQQIAQLAVAISGIAGPGGGSAAKPVGSVWIGWQCRGQASRCRLSRFTGTRNHIQQQCVMVALRGAIDLLVSENLTSSAKTASFI